MKRIVLALAMGSMMAGATNAREPLVETRSGKVEGRVAEGVETFMGIPYGADTGGPNRFLPPRPVASWSDIRPAKAMGHRCPQVTHSVPLGIITFSQDPISEDCLVLNVWTPSTRPARRAVMVWIHGGGFGFGAANDPMYDGASLARNENVVVVSLNHRLNAMGYLNLGPAAERDHAGAVNVGQLDIVQALQWVRANIARFGGNPDNVTVFGQSGGGAKVSTLLAMPAAVGLFQKAIIESGAVPKALTSEEALAQRDKLLAKLNLQPGDVLKLRDVPIDQLTAAIDAVGALSFKPWVDGQVIPRHPFTPDASATARNLPLMVGTARDEATAILAANPNWLKMDEAMVRAATAPLVGPANVDRAISLYKARRPADTPPQLYASIFTDFGFTHSAQIVVTRQAASGAKVWAFRTDWQSPVLNGVLRAPHAVELPFLFDTVAAAPGLVGTVPQPGMVRLFQHSFAAFARTGNPNAPGLPTWPSYDAERRSTFIYDVHPHVVSDPDPALRLFWDNVTKESTVDRQASRL